MKLLNTFTWISFKSLLQDQDIDPIKLSYFYIKDGYFIFFTEEQHISEWHIRIYGDDKTEFENGFILAGKMYSKAIATTIYEDEVSLEWLMNNGLLSNISDKLDTIIFENSFPNGSFIVHSDSSLVLLSGGTANYDYTVTAGKTLFIDSIKITSTVNFKSQIIIDPLSANILAGTAFNSTASRFIEINYNYSLKAASGKIVRVAVKNMSPVNSADIYYTLIGKEI